MLSSIFYFLIFGIGGIVLPFFPIWLLDTGLSVAQIGYVLGIGTMLKVVSNPATMMIVDVTGRLRAVALALILIVWVCYAGLIKVTSFSYIIALYFAISCFYGNFIDFWRCLRAAGHINSDGPICKAIYQSIVMLLGE